MKVYVRIPTLSTCSLQVQQFLLPLLKSSVTWLVNCQSYNSPIDTRFLMVRTPGPAGNLEHQLADNLDISHQYSIFHLQQKCRLYIFTYIYSTSIHTVDGSILAGVSYPLLLCCASVLTSLQCREQQPIGSFVLKLLQCIQQCRVNSDFIQNPPHQRRWPQKLEVVQLLSLLNSQQTLSPQRSHSTES